MSNYQTVVTATIANPQQIDGIATEVQLPDFRAAEQKYLGVAELMYDRVIESKIE